MSDVLSPTPQLLAKLGSALVHADEFLSDDGHPLDREAFNAALRDADLQAWIKGMAEMALVPQKRADG